MKRAQGKIKDFVELQAFDEMQDVFADTARALAAYRFTDATSDLLARWVNTLADLPYGQGAALALAGLRGCGKSHTLAALCALISLPHLRGGVSDAHVAASARRLSTRRYVLVHVRRGTRDTLIEELIDGFRGSFGETGQGGEDDAGQWGDDPATMLEVASLNAPDATLVIIVDTAYGRAARVNRDDGPLLSQLAAAALHINALVGLALDDDISGADGVNVALAEAYQIDYLDPEHIYRIADLYVLRKNAQARAALQEIYTRLRSSVPNFNWSEHRFTSTYPLHPLIADLTPAVRLFAPTFAFLPFAATASEKALLRPSLSLVVLDEVFDRIEGEMRASVDARDAVAAYDELAKYAVLQLPIMQRLQAKLMLKGLFVLSLDGRGATARELCAAMLFYDESDATAAPARITEMLDHFAAAAPAGSLEKRPFGDEYRYCFNIVGSSSFDAALAKRLADFSAQSAEIDDLLHNFAPARFPDWPLAGEEESDAAPLVEADFSFAWRGSDRPGRMLRQERSANGGSPTDAAPVAKHHDDLFYDWRVAILPPALLPDTNIIVNGFDIWTPAQPSPEEADVLRRLAALRADDALVAQFGDTARTTEAMLAARAELIWTRLYIEAAPIIIGGVRHQFNSAARGAPTLSEALAQMYAPVMDALYPQHPTFAARLDEDEVTNLIGGFFVGAYVTDPASQRLANLFAVPLGLATTHEGVLVPDAGGELLTRPWVQEVLGLTDEAENGLVALEDVYNRLRGQPYGLLREPQQLILAALVAQRQIELVLMTGEHAGRRALEGPLRWDEINGLRRSTVVMQGAEELTAWARLLTRQPHLPLLSDADSHQTIRAALAEWLAWWHANRLLPRFEDLPDQGLTTRTANLAAAVRKSFGVAAHAIEAVGADLIPHEEGLQRISDAFGGMIETFEHHSRQLMELSDYLAELDQRLEARDYLLMAEHTSDDEIESARGELLAMTDDVHTIFDPELRRRFRILWQEFQTRYIDTFARAHDAAVGGGQHQPAIDELINSPEWLEFEMLSLGVSLVNKQYWKEAENLVRRAKDLRCDLPVRHLLAKRPFCSCQFRLARVAEAARLVEDLRYAIERGRVAHRRTLELWGPHLSRALGDLALAEPSADADTARRLVAFFKQGTLPPY
ncbi:MAG TPA: hypothetical protein VM870_02910, partial [Pyrinomonadaceae bacterium]|nr:hypothetical protein [Pyrinomonadaceae bacterium]